MPRPNKFIFLFAIFCALVTALLAPKFLNPNHAQESPAVACVFDQKITRSQLDRAITEKRWLSGNSAAFNVDPSAVLDELIDHELLAQKLESSEHQPVVTPAESKERLGRFISRFESKAALESAMKSQGIPSEAALERRLTGQIRQEKFLDQAISNSTRVSDAEAREWFSKNSASLSNPERLEARHIFLPTLDHPPEEAKAKLDEALASLTEKKKDFATLAREISEDPATKDSGGALGWMTKQRLPADFTAPLFALPLNQPTLLRTRLGWHLVEVTARKPAETRSFEQGRAEIISALETIKKQEALKRYRTSLRDAARAEIKIF